MTFELNELEKAILEFIGGSKEGYKHREIIGVTKEKKLIWSNLHYHKSFYVWHEDLLEEFQNKRKTPKKKLQEAYAFLEKQGYVWWNNGHPSLTNKGKQYCGVPFEEASWP